MISYRGDREREGAFRLVDSRNLVEGFRNLVAHEANELMHEKHPPDRERFYDVVDAGLRVMMRGLKPPHRPVGPSISVSAESGLDRLAQRQRTHG